MRYAGGRLEALATSQNAPGDARRFVSVRNRQNITVQPFFGGLDPRF